MFVRKEGPLARRIARLLVQSKVWLKDPAQKRGSALQKRTTASSLFKAFIAHGTYIILIGRSLVMCSQRTNRCSGPHTRVHGITADVLYHLRRSAQNIVRRSSLPQHNTLQTQNVLCFCVCFTTVPIIWKLTQCPFWSSEIPVWCPCLTKIVRYLSCQSI